MSLGLVDVVSTLSELRGERMPMTGSSDAVRQRGLPSRRGKARPSCAALAANTATDNLTCLQSSEFWLRMRGQQVCRLLAARTCG